ncbi:MAG: hypothetical protein NTW29_14405 [Bacteroidetes bacterium]|nr:hypothetical protein [Bacteroidota bacterium]
MNSILTILFLSLSITFSLPSKAQSDTLLYYFDNDFYFAHKDTAVLEARGVKENGKIKFTVVVKGTNILKLEGYYSDSTMSVRDGYFIFYNTSGLKESSGLFVKNLEEKYWVYWVNDVITDSVLFYHGEETLRITLLYNADNQLESRSVKNRLSGLDELVLFYEDGKQKKYSKLFSGTGESTEFYPNGTAKSKLVFKKYQRQSATYYHEDGSEMTQEEMATYLKKNEPTETDVYKNNKPEFPGGTKGLQSYFERNFRFPSNISQQATMIDFLTIEFYLDKKGYAYDIKVENSANYELIQAVKELFRNMPPWNMNGSNNFGPINYRFKLTH